MAKDTQNSDPAGNAADAPSGPAGSEGACCGDDRGGEVQTNTEPVTITLRIDEIQRAEELQPRVGIDKAVVKQYAERLQAGDKFPPVHVFDDGNDKWLADGYFRCGAEEASGDDTIVCLVHRGTKADAEWYALQANKRHGAQLTNADKARAIKKALRHPVGANLSDRQIAEHVGASHATVGKYRAELESTGQVDQSPQRVGRDGREIDTTGIGSRSSKDAASSPAETPTCRNCGAHEVDEDGDCLKCREPDVVAPSPDLDGDDDGEEVEAGQQGGGDDDTTANEAPEDADEEDAEAAHAARKRHEAYCRRLPHFSEGGLLTAKDKPVKAAADAAIDALVEKVRSVIRDQSRKRCSKAIKTVGDDETLLAMVLTSRLRQRLDPVELFAPKDPCDDEK